MARQLTHAGRNISGQFSLIDIGTDAFGRRVNHYNGTPIRIIGDDETGTQILRFNEDPGDTTADTTSIYLIKFGDEENVTGLLGGGGSMEVRDFGETQAAPGHLGRIEFYPGLAILSKYSVVRLTGFTAS